MDYDRIRPVRFLTGVLKWWRLWPRKESVSTPDWTNWQAYALHVPFTFLFVLLLWLEAIKSRDIQHTADVLLICLTTTALGGKVINIWKYAHVAQGILSEWSTWDLFRAEEQTGSGYVAIRASTFQSCFYVLLFVQCWCNPIYCDSTVV